MSLVVPSTDLSPVCPNKFDQANFNGDLCSLMQQLLLTNDKLHAFFKWMFNQEPDGCQLSAAFAAGLVGLSMPIGGGFWSLYDMSLDLEEWVPADGRSLAKEGVYKPLHIAFGENKFKPDTATHFYVPDLRGRMILQAGKRDKYDADDEKETEPVDYIVGTKGGFDKVKIKETEIGPHRHGLAAYHIYQEDEWRDDNGSGNDRAATSFTPPTPVKAFTGAWNDVGEAIGTQNLDGYTRVSTTTTENVVTIPFTEEDDKTEGHDNIPPYWTGIYYIRANYKINGTIIAMKSAV